MPKPSSRRLTKRTSWTRSEEDVILGILTPPHHSCPHSDHVGASLLRALSLRHARDPGTLGAPDENR